MRKAEKTFTLGMAFWDALLHCGRPYTIDNHHYLPDFQYGKFFFI